MHQSETKIQIWIYGLRRKQDGRNVNSTWRTYLFFPLENNRNNIRVTEEVTLKSAREIELTVCTSFPIN